MKKLFVPVVFLISSVAKAQNYATNIVLRNDRIISDFIKGKAASIQKPIAFTHL